MSTNILINVKTETNNYFESSNDKNFLALDLMVKK